MCEIVWFHMDVFLVTKSLGASVNIENNRCKCDVVWSIDIQGLKCCSLIKFLGDIVNVTS